MHVPGAVSHVRPRWLTAGRPAPQSAPRWRPAGSERAARSFARWRRGGDPRLGEQPGQGDSGHRRVVRAATSSSASSTAAPPRSRHACAASGRRDSTPPGQEALGQREVGQHGEVPLLGERKQRALEVALDEVVATSAPCSAASARTPLMAARLIAPGSPQWMRSGRSPRDLRVARETNMRTAGDARWGGCPARHVLSFLTHQVARGSRR